MAHLAVIAPPFAGHLQPMQAIARSLAARGHRVSFVTLSGAARHLDPATPQLRLASPDLPPDFLVRLERLIGAMPPIHRWPDTKTLRHLLVALAQMTRSLCREAPARLAQAGIDAMLVDQTEPAGGLIARHLGLPFATIANALPIDPDPALPPVFTNWPPARGPLGRLRNRIGYGIADHLSGPINAEILSWSAYWGLGKLRSLADCRSPCLQLAQIVPAFDFPRQRLPPEMVFCGPFRGGAPPPGPPPPQEANAFVTLGSLQGGRGPLLRAMALACHAAGLRPLAVHGGRLQAEPADWPSGTFLRHHAAHGAILAQAKLTLCHGGLNTVLDSLIAGVPLLIVPLAFEQAAIAQRIIAAGAGLAVRAGGRQDDLTAKLVCAVSKILRDPTYAARAAALGHALQLPGGAALAAQMMETVCLTPSP